MTTIYRRGRIYIIAEEGEIPKTLGRPEAMALIKEANDGKLPAHLNFDLVRRIYWQWPEERPEPEAKPEPDPELTRVLKLMADKAAVNYGGKHHGNQGQD